MKRYFFIFLLPIVLTGCTKALYIYKIEYYQKHNKSDIPPPELHQAILKAYDEKNEDAVEPIFHLILSKKYNNLFSATVYLSNYVYKAVEINPRKSLPYLKLLADDSDNIISNTAFGVFMDFDYHEAIPFLEELYRKETNTNRKIIIDITLIYLNNSNKPKDYEKIKYYWTLEKGRYIDYLLKIIDQNNYKYFANELTSCLYHDLKVYKQGCVIKIINMDDVELLKKVEIKLLKDDPDVSPLILNHACNHKILYMHCQKFVNSSNIETQKAAQRCIEYLKESNKQ